MYTVSFAVLFQGLMKPVFGPTHMLSQFPFASFSCNVASQSYFVLYCSQSCIARNLVLFLIAYDFKVSSGLLSFVMLLLENIKEAKCYILWIL